MKRWILIPDISGFTQFVHETAISHSGHIIQELLQILTDSVTLEMDLIEIEGDALFFLGRGPVPNISLLEGQVEQMFLKFHEHLLLYEQRRVCPCGACRTAHTLSLKFVVHAGPVEYIEVAGHKKPHGSTVIAAHRLLKNSILSEEYALFSSAIDSSARTEYTSGQDSYDFGSISYQYKNLGFLKDNQKIPEIRKVSYLREPDIKLSKKFNTDLQTLADLVLDLAQRPLWNQNITELQFDENEINQSGANHICIINGQRLNIETVLGDPSDGELVFGERTTDVPGIDRLTTFWIITTLSESHYQLDMEVYLDQKKLWKRLITPIIKFKFKKAIKNSLNNLEEIISTKAL